MNFRKIKFGWITVALALVAVATTILALTFKKKEGYTEASPTKYPHWGWGANKGLRCTSNNNTGCNTMWVDGKLVEKPPPVDCKPPKQWKNDQCVCIDPLAVDTASGWCTACTAPFVKNKDGTCVCPDGKVWRNNQCLPPLVDCKPPKQWKNDQCVCIDSKKVDTASGWCTACRAPFVLAQDGSCNCPDGMEWKNDQCMPKASPGDLPDFTWDQRVRQCYGLGKLMPGGQGDAYVCKTNPNIRKGSEYAWDIEWQCCKNTNYDCHKSGIKGIWQAASQAGLKPSGYWTEDDGCNLDVFGLDGQEIAVNKIGGLWKLNPLNAFGQGNWKEGLGSLPFVPPMFKTGLNAGLGAAEYAKNH